MAEDLIASKSAKALALSADDLLVENIGIIAPAKIASIVMTIKSSRSVKPFFIFILTFRFYSINKTFEYLIKSLCPLNNP